MAKKPKAPKCWLSETKRDQLRITRNNTDDQLYVIENKRTGQFHTLRGGETVFEMYPPSKIITE